MSLYADHAQEVAAPPASGPMTRSRTQFTNAAAGSASQLAVQGTAPFVSMLPVEDDDDDEVDAEVRSFRYSLSHAFKMLMMPLCTFS